MTSDTSNPLASLAALPGVVWAGLLNRRSATMEKITADGQPSSCDPTERVLTDAILTATAALSNLQSLGKPKELHQVFENGGLFSLEAHEDLWLLVRHESSASLPLIRLTLKEICLFFQTTPAPAQQKVDAQSFGNPAPAAPDELDTPDFGMDVTSSGWPEPKILPDFRVYKTSLSA